MPRVSSLVIVGGLALLLFACAAVIVGLLGGSDPLDDVVYEFVQFHRSAMGTAIAAGVTTFGSYQIVIVLTLLFALITYERSRRFTDSVMLVVSAPLASSLVFMIKIVMSRPRPPSALIMGESPIDYSFPSGHTTSGSVVFVLGALLISSYLRPTWARRTVQIVGVCMAILIGGSRVYLGYHWATDVFGGWLLATSLVALAVLLVSAVDQLRPVELVRGAPAGVDPVVEDRRRLLP